MNLQKVKVYPYFSATCSGCLNSLKNFPKDIYADLDSQPFTYYCEECKDHLEVNKK